jgi:hypothetical protein
MFPARLFRHKIRFLFAVLPGFGDFVEKRGPQKFKNFVVDEQPGHPKGGQSDEGKHPAVFRDHFRILPGTVLFHVYVHRAVFSPKKSAKK